MRISHRQMRGKRGGFVSNQSDIFKPTSGGADKTYNNFLNDFFF